MNTPHLLLVDDAEPSTGSLGAELVRLGWQVQTVHHPDAAVQALRQNAFDALVLDLRSPGLCVIVVLSELSRLLTRPVSVLLSDHLNVAVTVRAIQDGADDVLEAPVSPGELDTRLRALLATKGSSSAGTSAALLANSEFRKVLGETAGMRVVREQMQTAARYPELCLTIVGESGTGKELVAEAIHSLGTPSGRYLPVTLGAIPDQLLEIELFGSEAVGGREGRAGLFELAGAGTLFFNELTALPSHLHPKLLRVLETRTFTRLGGDHELPLQARVIAGTRRRSPSPECAELYERLGAFTIHLPSLRDRVPDIELIAGHVLADVSVRTGKPALTLSEPALEVLVRHNWPGNVRELELVLNEAATAAAFGVLSAEEVRAAIGEHGMPSEADAAENASGTFLASPGPVSEPLRSLERRMITDAWQISGRNLSAAARTLGLPRTTLRDRLKKYGLR